MRVSSYQHSRRDLGESNAMTPMIDVVFLLLIFFVCASTNQIQEFLLPTDLSAGTVESPDIAERDPWFAEIWLKLRNDPATQSAIVVMNGTDYPDWNALKSQLELLAEVGPENPVIIAPEGDVAVEHVVRLLDLCKATKFESVNFSGE